MESCQNRKHFSNLLLPNLWGSAFKLYSHFPALSWQEWRLVWLVQPSCFKVCAAVFFYVIHLTFIYMGSPIETQCQCQRCFSAYSVCNKCYCCLPINQILSDLSPQQDIFAKRIAAIWIFSLFHTIFCKPQVVVSLNSSKSAVPVIFQPVILASKICYI